MTNLSRNNCPPILSRNCLVRSKQHFYIDRTLKKKKKNDLQVSLFPFLSILACVLGILTLMITAIVIAQIDPEAITEKVVTAYEEDVDFQAKIDEQKAVIDKIKEEIKSLRANPEKKLDPKRKDKLQVEIFSLEEKRKKILADNKQAAALKATSLKMTEEVAKLTRDLLKAEDEWELMKDPSKFATMVVKQSGSGAGGDLEPTFIECRSEGLKVYENGKLSFELKTALVVRDTRFQNLIKKVAREAPYRFWVSTKGTQLDARFVKREGINLTLKDKKGKEWKLTTTQLSKASQRIARKYEDARKAKMPDPTARYVIFLIRSKGVSAWSQAAKVCAKFGCKYGQLPLDGEGELDLSLFSGS